MSKLARCYECRVTYRVGVRKEGERTRCHCGLLFEHVNASDAEGALGFIEMRTSRVEATRMNLHDVEAMP